jgi:hypothetical protein
MSRAPGPIETTTPITNTPMTNPYPMHTYSMPPPMHGAPMMSPHTNTPVHAMQNIYSNMHLQSQMAHPQQQQLASPAYVHGMHPSTMQNVSVVDFKPETVVNSQVAHLQQQYQNHLNAMSAAPSMGLIGHDGQYIPATAATPYTSDERDPRAFSPQGISSLIDESVDRRVNANMERRVNANMERRVNANMERRVNASVDRRMNDRHGPGISTPFHHKSHAESMDEQRAIISNAVNGTSVPFHQKSHAEKHAIVSSAVRSAFEKHRVGGVGDSFNSDDHGY